MELFIKDLKIDDIRGINSFFIPLSSNKRKHLILTGKNGSGKTSTLIEINHLLMKLYNNQFQNLQQYYKNILSMENAIENQNNQIEFFKQNIKQSNEKISSLNKIILENKDNITLIKQSEDEIITQRNNIESFEHNSASYYSQINEYKQNIEIWKNNIKNFSKIDINFVNQEYIFQSLNEGSFIMAFFEAKRKNESKVPTGVQKLNIQKKNPTSTNLNQQFIQYLLNLRMEMLDAMAENEKGEVSKINNWFTNFENSLKELFDNESLHLKYKKKEFNFKIEYDDKSFGLNELSDGYSAVLSIVTELILRMEAHNSGSYDLQGVVLIDELETHLHVGLQKKIFPFLTKFFPKIQFIITTHSPFILSSLKNVIICDLEKKQITEDLTAYSYESLVDSYFNIDKYSNKVKEELTRYQSLSNKFIEKNLTDDDKIEFVKLETYFENLPFFGNEELGIQIKQIRDMVK
jgi:predicted ATP-binding protein involved in virulence